MDEESNDGPFLMETMWSVLKMLEISGHCEFGIGGYGVENMKERKIFAFIGYLFEKISLAHPDKAVTITMLPDKETFEVDLQEVD